MRFLSGCTVLVALAAGWASGCSSTNTASGTRVVAPFTPELARVFDDTVDHVENVEEIGGRVASDWRHQIEELARNADFVGVVRVETVTAGTDSSASQSFRLTVMVVGNPFRGELPRDRRMDLRVDEGEAGYHTVRASANRLQTREWIAFVRWSHDEEGYDRPHWHLTPHNAPTLQRVQDIIGYTDPNAPRETVVRVNN